MKMVTTGTAVFFVCLVIQFCAVPSLAVQTNVQQDIKFLPITDVEKRVEINLERNDPKVTLD